MLWGCFIRSGGKRSGGYIQKVKEMWDGRDLSVRKEASLLSQLKCIETKGLVLKMEREEIRRKVLQENGVINKCGDMAEGVEIEVDCEDKTVTGGEIADGEDSEELGVKINRDSDVDFAVESGKTDA